MGGGNQEKKVRRKNKYCLRRAMYEQHSGTNRNLQLSGRIPSTVQT